MHATHSHRLSRPHSAQTRTAGPQPSPLLRWAQIATCGLVACLALSACGGDDNNGSDGKAREVRCAR